MKQLLSQSAAYIALQRVVGADRLRYRCIDELAIAEGETVVDVGCGPAYYFERLPQPIDYHGFDTAPEYIGWADKRWGDRAHFHLGTFDADSAAAVGPVDAVLLLGVLHHLSDDESSELLRLIAGVLSPTGRVVALDTCFTPGQGRTSRWMAEHDRGEYVRTSDEFVALAAPHLRVTKGEVLSDSTRLPGSYWMMSLAAHSSS